MKKRVKLSIALAMAVLVVGWPVAAHYQAKARVRDCLKQLRARGEKLTVAELTPMVSSESLQQSVALMVAAGRLSTGTLTDMPPTMRLIAPGRAMVAWQQPALPTMDSEDLWPGLRQSLEHKADTLAAAREALPDGAVAFALDYNQGYAMLLPHLSSLKVMAQWLSAATIQALHDGRPDEAFENLDVLTGLVARYRDEPIMISELVRIAIGQIALNATWEALQWPRWEEHQLLTLQTNWESVDLLTQAEGVFAMERVVNREVFEKARESYAALNSMWGVSSSSQGLNELAEFGKHLLEDPKDAFKEVSQRFPKYWAWRYWRSYEDELVNMLVTQAALEAMRKARSDKALEPALEQFQAATRQLRRAHPRAGTWMDITSVLSGGLDRFLTRVAALERQRSLLVAAIALKRYQLQHGAYPPELTALAPALVAAVPRDSIRGQPLRYRLEPAGGYQLFSDGEDGKDNGGDPTPAPDATANNPFRQWWRARDAVWPQPASREQGIRYLDRLIAEIAKRKSAASSSAASSGAGEAFLRRYGLKPLGVPSVTNSPAERK